jgi:hypothetical protein
MPGRVKCKPVGVRKELLGSGTARAYKSASSLSGGKFRQPYRLQVQGTP